MRTAAALCVFGFGGIGAARAAAAEPAGPALLAVGDLAPDLEAKDAAGKPVRLSQELRRGHAAIVYFYPKDETPGCTKEACAFRDAFDKLNKAGVTIFAVSRDSESSHAAFREHEHLPFPMAADPSGAVQRAYHVPTLAVGGGEKAARVSFLVAPDGKIARVWPTVDPVIHAREVLDAAATLKRR